MLLTILIHPLTGWSQAKTTYKLTQVTSVAAGNKYVFEQSDRVMNNTISSSALQTTDTYNTTGLTGTETYVWELESASNDNFYMKNVSLNSNQYLRNASSGNLSLSGSNNATSWNFAFQQDNTVYITNPNNSNRFLGYNNNTAWAYKAYATGGNYAHAIKVYLLEEESTTATVTIDSPMNLPATATVNGTINVTKSNITPNSDSSIEFYDNSECTGSTITPGWFSASFATIAKGTDYDHITYSAAVNNTGSARTPIYMKVTLTDGTNSPYAVVEINQYPYYTVTFNGHGGTYNSNPTYTQSIPGGVATNLPTNQFVNPNYTFTQWTTNDNGTGEVYTDGQSVTLTSPLANLYAQWAQLYTIAIDDGITHGTVTADAASALAGATVTLTITPSSGYILDELQYVVNEVATDITGNTFTMPANNVTITASFILAEIYEKHTGALAEGDYVIISGTTALKNATKSNGLDYVTGISINEDDQIINPDETIVWHIAPSETDGYWTIYNAKAKQYAASTGAKNKATLSSDGTDDKSLWSFSGSSTYEIVNKQNTTNSVNANLRYNSGNYWACYSTSTGSSLKLYKLAEPERTLTSITISGQTTDYIVDETFSFDGECVAHYDNGSSKTVTPTSVTSPDMSSTGSKDITVTYTESGVSKTASYTITVITNPYSTTSLTGSNMSAMSNAGTTYNNIKSVTTGDGFTWVSNGYQDGNGSLTNMIQIRARDHEAGVSYVKLPDVNGALKRITLTVTAAGATASSGTGTPNILYFQASNTSTETPITQGGGTTTNSIVLDLRQSFCTSGYITASGALRIWSIVLEYLPYENNGSAAISDIPIQTAVAVTNSAATASTLTIPKSSSLCIKSGAKLTVTGTLTNNGNENNLIIEDGGQLIHTNAVNATLHKEVTGYGANPEVTTGWYTIASPVAGLAASTVATTEDYDLFAYQESNFTWLNTLNNTLTFAEGQGFLYANSADQTLAYAGSMKATNAEVSINLSYTAGAGALAGYNLVGNPFSRNLTSGEVKVGGSAITTYYVSEGGSNLTPRAIADYPIKPGQGFFVQATGTGQQIVFNPGSKDYESTNKPAFISIEASNSSFTDRAYVQLGGGNTLRKMSVNDNVHSLYVMQDGKDYASATIDSYNGSIPVCFKATETGRYTINVQTTGIDADYLHLIDRYTGADVDLLSEPSYTFIATKDDYESRFTLVFTADGSDTNNDIFAYQSGSAIIVNGNGELQIFDVTGRRVMTTTINGMESINIPNQGVYIFKLNEKVQKIVVR